MECDSFRLDILWRTTSFHQQGNQRTEGTSQDRVGQKKEHLSRQEWGVRGEEKHVPLQEWLFSCQIRGACHPLREVRPIPPTARAQKWGGLSVKEVQRLATRALFNKV